MSIAGRPGVLVATPDPAAARRDREWLEDAGIPAALPAELGLKLKRHPATDRSESIAAAWSRALRMPAVESDAEAVHVAGATSVALVDRGDALDRLRTAMKLPVLPRVAVFGGAWVGSDEPEFVEAMRFGRGLGEVGVEVVTGGYQGIMAAASRGCAESGRTAVVGVTIEPWSVRVPVNEWLTVELEARDLFARLPVICDADAWVAFPGGVGTLSEIALCWSLVQTQSLEPRPLVIVGERWDRALRTFRELLIAEDDHFDLVRPAEDADRAFETLGQVTERGSFA